MRIISQNQKIDVPYEQSLFFVESGQLYAQTFEMSDSNLIGVYPTDSDAINELLRISSAYAAGAKTYICTRRDHNASE